MLGEQGGRLSQITALGDATHRIAEAIQWLRHNFDQPLRIEEIARKFGMSVSGFHHHFRALTAMSPLQFQKQLRLQEARRLMLSEGFDAASAGYNVGYSTAAQFTREYKRLFGTPPCATSNNCARLSPKALPSFEYRVVSEFENR